MLVLLPILLPLGLFLPGYFAARLFRLPLWAPSAVGYTSGGVEISMRVLGPALVALSIAGGWGIGAMDGPLA
jgi:hypothetical protein